jgi:hypothetical protein
VLISTALTILEAPVASDPHPRVHSAKTHHALKFVKSEQTHDRAGIHKTEFS